MATIVAVHAHPDDEALLSGGWLAQRAAAGDRVVLVFATDGGGGLAAVGYGGADGALAGVRRTEASRSARALGVARLAWLGYADSGMATDPTRGPRRFADVPVEEAARRIAEILDEEDADLLTGYDAHGGYGHPDHVQVHRAARAAQARAGRRPRLLEVTVDRTRLLRVLRPLRVVARFLPGLTLPSGRIYVGPEEITLVADVRDQVTAKRAALAAHASQGSGGVRTLRLLLAVPGPLARRVLGTEWFIEVP